MKNHRIFFLGALLWGCASSDQVQQLEEKVEKLEKEVAQLKTGNPSAKSSIDTEKERRPRRSIVKYKLQLNPMI